MGVPTLATRGIKSVASVVPSHVTLSADGKATLQALVTKSKTVPLQIITCSDSNGVGGTFNASSWDRDSFARALDRQLGWMRANDNTGTSDKLGPQLQVIKLSTMGNAASNSNVDTPWHPNYRRWMGEMRVSVGPFANSWKTMGGYAVFNDPALTPTGGRMMGFLLDRTKTGEDWERSMDQVACGYYVSSAGQVIGATTNNCSSINGTAFAGPDYSGNTSTFRLSIRNVDSIDFSGIPATGWDEGNAACIAIRAAIMAIGETAGVDIDPNWGAGAPIPGARSNWLSGMTANHKWFIMLSVPNGATNMGSYLEYLVVQDSTRTGGAKVWDFAYSGNAISHCEFIRYNDDGTTDPTWGADPFTGAVIPCFYVGPSLASRILMRGENTYSKFSWYGHATFAGATATQHTADGLDIVIINLLVNDISGTIQPVAIKLLCANIVAQVKRVNPSAFIIFNLPPCQMFIGGDNVRDNYFTGAGSAAGRKDADFRAVIKEVAAANSANVGVIDYQAAYGNIAPTALKARMGKANYSRQAGDPTDGPHFHPSVWHHPSIADIGKMLSTWCYL